MIHRCRICRTPGHKAETCPLVPESDGLGHLTRDARWRVRLRWRGMCGRCGKNPSPDRWHCAACAAKKARYDRGRRAAG